MGELSIKKLLEDSFKSKETTDEPFIIGRRLVPIWHIPVQFVDNEEDWVFTFVDAGNGRKVMAVF